MALYLFDAVHNYFVCLTFFKICLLTEHYRYPGMGTYVLFPHSFFTDYDNFYLPLYFHDRHRVENNRLKGYFFFSV